MQDANKEDDLFRFLFFKQCNDLSRILPRLFEDLDGSNSFSELLIVLSFNDPNGVVYRLVNEVDERWFDIHATDEDGKPLGQVQIMGWMYQYYNTEPKDKVFADLKKNIKISKQNIPAATQLFTPDWIVRYMVENSLGRLWAEGHPDFDKSDWKYYLDEAPQEPQVEQQLKDIRAQYAKMDPEQLKVIDPCMGSGHILCYLFDVLMQIYLDNGYSKREAVRSILENNLFGLDIDKRAAQFAYFSVMMKAHEYDSGFFGRKNIPQPRVYDIQESNWMGGAYKHEMGSFLNSQEHRDTLNYLLDTFIDAKEYGSILQIKPLDYEGLKEVWETSAAATASNVNMAMWYDAVKDSVEQLIEQAIMLSQKYDAVVTNPPYAGTKGLNQKLTNFLTSKYEEEKGDMFAVFVERTNQMANNKGYVGLITPTAWIYNPSYMLMRKRQLGTMEISSLVELGSNAFEVGFGTMMFVFSPKRIRDNYIGTYYDVKEKVEVNTNELNFASAKPYMVKMKYFSDYENVKFSYKLTPPYRKILLNSPPLSKYGCPRAGLQTDDNARFIREWYEVELCRTNFHHKAGDAFGDEKWFPHIKGGTYRKWYGNLSSVVNWQYDGAEIKENASRKYGSYTKRVQSMEFYFQEGIAWTHTTYSQPFACRYIPEGVISNVEGPEIFRLGLNQPSVLGMLNSKVMDSIFLRMSDSIHYLAGELSKFPVRLSNDPKVEQKVKENIEASKEDWDAFETSWDFKRHPLV